MLEKYNIVYTRNFYVDISEVVWYIENVLKNSSAAESLIDNVKEAIEKRAMMPTSFKSYGVTKKDNLKRYYVKIRNFYAFYVVKEKEKLMEFRQFIYARSNVAQRLE